jgi:predicted secreted Zn-dependent protease
VLFSHGQHNPASQEGIELLAHELIHVAQQPTVHDPCCSKVDLVEENSLEHEASEGAKQLSNGYYPALNVRSGNQLLLCDKNKTAHKEPAAKTTISSPSHDFYTINAETLAEAAKVMEKQSEDQNSGAGKTDWVPNLTYAFDENGVVVKATVTVTLKITMPKWSNAEKISKPAKAEWDRFYKALEKHEDGHVQLVKSELSDIADSLIGKSEDIAKEDFKKATDALQEKSDTYDVETDHGKKRGCIIDTGIK